MVMCVELAPGIPFDMFPYNPNAYTEAQWMPSTMASMPGFEYGSGAAYTSSPSQQHQQHPHHPHHHQQQQPPHQQQQHQPQSQPQQQQQQQSRRTPHIEVSSVPQHLLDGDRPKSSAGNFTNAEDVSQYSHQHQHQHQTQQSPHDDPSRYASSMSAYGYHPTTLPLSPPTSTAAYLTQDMGSAMGGGAASLTRASPVPIAPNPTDTRKRKRNTSTPERPPELTEEEKLLLKLKEDENLPWKDIAVRFQQEIGKTYQVPALQMRFKRLRERIRVWTENDIQALEQAYEYWEKHQFEIIATKMLDFGCPERFPSKAVQRKWEELHHDKLAAQRQPFPFASANSTAAYAAAAAYPGSHGVLPSQHGFVRHLSIGPGASAAAAAAAASGISPFSSPGGSGGGHAQFLFGQSAGSQPLLSPAPGSITGSATAASVYGTSPLVSSNNKFSVVGPPSGNNGSSGNPGNTRSTSIPTPRSAGASPGPFTAPDDAALAAGGTTSITEVGGVNMGLGLGLSISPSVSNESLRPTNAGRQRSFSSMH